MLAKDKFYQSLFEQTNDAVFILDLEGVHIKVNSRASEMLGYTQEEMKKLTYRDLSAEVNQSTRTLDDLLKGAVYPVYDRNFKKKNGDVIAVEVNIQLIRDDKEKPLYIQSVIRDVSKRKKLEANIQTKEKLLYAVVEFTQELLTNCDYHDAIMKGISMIGKATGVDRAYYWENNYDLETHTSFTSQKYEWCTSEVVPQINNPDLQNIPFEEVLEFVGPLSKNEILMTLVKDMKDGNTKTLLEKQEIVSILVLPIFTKGVFWGFVGFDECRYEKIWSEVEISLLKSFAHTLSKAIERNQLEEEVGQARQNFNNFFNTINDMLFVIDLEGRIVDINKTACNVLGYLKEEIVGKSASVLNNDSQNEFEKEKTIGPLTGESVFFTETITTKIGIRIPVETRVVTGEWNGTPTLFVATKDISEIKRSEEKFAKAFHAGAVLKTICKCEDGLYIDVNNTFLTTLGFERHEVIGKKATDLNLFVNKEQEKNILKGCECSEKNDDIEVVLRGKEGALYTVILNIKPITLEGIPCSLTTMTDITIRKEIEEELVRTKKIAENASMEKDRFLSNISHEVRTPMNAVIAYVDLLNNMEMTAKQQKYLDNIRISAEMLLSIINDILDMKKLDSGEMSMVVLPFRIEDILNNAISQVKVKSDRKGLKISKIIDENVPEILNGDPFRLQQIATNLLDNSVKNTDEGEVEIRVNFVENNKSNIKLQFSVYDTGIGMSEEQIEKVFIPFYQAEAEARRKQEGTGLGLSICQSFIKLYGGTIWVESELGKGTTVFFTASFDISQKLSDDRLKKDSEKFYAHDSVILEQFQGIQVLMVEDNEINQDVLNEMLHTVGMIVTIANNGIEAINYLKYNDFDIVLMDIRMPDMDGYETTSEIRKIKSFKELPIIAVTASAMVDDIERCILASMNDYISKPINKVLLFQTMAKWINKRDLHILGNKSSRQYYSEEAKNESIKMEKEVFQNLEGIDVKIALDRLGGNQHLLYKLLIKFHNNQKSVIDKIRHSIEIGDINTAERLTHTIRGSAGDIAAQEIFSDATRLETEIHKGKFDNTEALLGSLEQKLTRVFESIELMESNFVKPSIIKMQTLNVSILKPLLDDLEGLILERDMGVNECLEEIHRHTKDTSLAQLVTEMMLLGDQFCFDEVLKLLSIFKQFLYEEAINV